MKIYTVKNEGRAVVFGPARLSYTHLFKKYVPDTGGEGKYMTNILIPKKEKEVLEALGKAMGAAREFGVQKKWGGKVPKKLDLPLRDGDEKDPDKDPDGVFAGHFYLNAKCNTRPGVVDREGEPITDEDEVYSGMYANVSLTFFPYLVSGNAGVSCGLNNVQKVKDGDRLGGRSSAKADFAGIPADEFDDEDDDDVF